jgi:pimeloyl-ACP methyl ester carboxylesterase
VRARVTCADVLLRRLLLVGLIVLASACAHHAGAGVQFANEPALAAVGELGPCDATQAPKRIDPRADLVVLVHGCNASHARYHALAALFELHDQQTLCFRYDDRRRVGDVARDLRASLAKLAAHLERREITILGHSQGGLMTRVALASADQPPLITRRGPLKVSLVTVSTPFNGIQAAADCGRKWLHALTLGTTYAVCYAIAGSKWRDIHPSAALVMKPAPLGAFVQSHVEIRTDERDTCRRWTHDGRCARSDYVFSVDEQRNPRVDDDRRVTPELLVAGHAEIVGQEDTPPRKLLTALQRHGLLRSTPAHKEPALQALLKRLF